MQVALKQLTGLETNSAVGNGDVLLTIPPGKSILLENVRYDNGTLKIYVLEGQEYVETDTSLALPIIPVQEIIPFIDHHTCHLPPDICCILT